MVTQTMVHLYCGTPFSHLKKWAIDINTCNNLDGLQEHLCLVKKSVSKGYMLYDCIIFLNYKTIAMEKKVMFAREQG